MRRTLLRWLSPLAVGLALALPAVGQAPPAPEAEKGERPPPALQTAVAVLFTIAILFIVCKPSRKG